MGSLFGIFAGIFGLFGSLFSKKGGNGGYFLELDEAKGLGTNAPAALTQTTEAAPKPAAKKVAKKAATKAEVIVPAQPVAAAIVAPSEPKIADKPAKGSKSKKTAKPAKSAEPETAKPTSAAQPAEPVFTVANFATDYLLSNGSPRRRPGANMNSFLDMARKMNQS